VCVVEVHRSRDIDMCVLWRCTDREMCVCCGGVLIEIYVCVVEVY